MRGYSRGLVYYELDGYAEYLFICFLNLGECIGDAIFIVYVLWTDFESTATALQVNVENGYVYPKDKVYHFCHGGSTILFISLNPFENSSVQSDFIID